jgi:acyltransferase
MIKERIAWIDAAKGIGICLVVLGHIYESDSSVLMYIYSFHVPLFFFLSGYLFSSSRYEGYIDFLKNKVRTRFVPYFFFFSISYVVILISISNETGMSIVSILAVDGFKPGFLEIIARMLRANGESLGSINIALWFLPCLLITEFYFFSLVKFTGSNTVKIGTALIAASLGGYYLSISGHTRLPWSLDTAVTSLVFYGTGYLCRISWKTPDISKFGSRNAEWLLLAFSAVVCAFLSNLNGRVDMNSNSLGNFFYFYGAALAGIYFSRCLASFFPQQAVLSYLGKNAIIIFGIHIPLYPYAHLSVVKVTDIFFKEPVVIQNDLYVFLMASVVLLFTVPVIYVINTFIPVVAGQNRASLNSKRVRLNVL